MNEHDWSKQFNNDVERLLSGKKVTVNGLEGTYNMELKIARQLAETDFSSRSKIRATLRQQLLNKMQSGQAKNWNDKAMELNEEDLDNIAAAGPAGNDSGCSHCSCKRRSWEIEGNLCPKCRHPRSSHR